MPILKMGDAGVVEYDDRGVGPLVVLIHGSPGTSRAWQAVGERLVSRFLVAAPNLPGTGGSTRRPDETRADNSPSAEAVEALIAEVGPPTVLAGHSHGGFVALMTALRGKVRPAALALFEPVAVPILDLVGERQAHASAKALGPRGLRRAQPGDDGPDRESHRVAVPAW